MSAAATLRVCTVCRNNYTVIGWQLDGRCGGCREKQRAEDMARTACADCGGPMTPAENRRQCDDCWRAEHVAAIEKWGSE